MPATVRYNTLRLALLIVVGVVCYLAGARGAVLLMLALLISLPLSFVLLKRWRLAMIDEIASGKARKLNPVRAINQRIEAGNDAEDAALDAAEAAERTRAADGEPGTP
jgi:hypothetical protein